MKLKGRLITASMLMLVLTVGVLSISNWLISSYYNTQILEKTSENMSEQYIKLTRSHAAQTVAYLSEALVNPLYFYDIGGIELTITPALNNQSILEITVFDKNGILAQAKRSETDSYGVKLDMPELEKTVLENKTPYFQNEDDYFILAEPLLMNNELLGGFKLTYSLTTIRDDIEKNRSLIEQINLSSKDSGYSLTLIVTLIMTVLSLWFSALIARNLIDPIQNLVNHSKLIGKGDYETPNNVDRKDEIGELAKAFDEMGTCLKERNEAIEFLAYNDPLTKLPNRTYFLNNLNRMMNSTVDSIVVFFIDLDGFKKVNDSLGHAAGDELLQAIAKRINQNLRHSDRAEGTAARVGGDEFLLCFPNLSNKEVMSRIAKRIIDEFSKPVYLKEPDEWVVVGASIGIATYPESADNSEDLVKNADIAMYYAKSNGKGHYCHFNQELEQQVIVKGQIERDLRIALEDLTQFQLHYQPKIALTSNKVIGAEALLRWIHPEQGNIAPNEFIPVAETSGLIVPMGEWVIDQACRFLQQWQKKTGDSAFHVAVNLSAKQLYDSKVIQYITDKLVQYELGIGSLHIEVTETALLNDRNRAKKTIDSLRALGVEVWLDDFGTGYSSLGFLRQFNVDGLKIDRSFIKDTETDQNDRSLCNAIITMAHQLDIGVVAEGIETQAQANFLIESQCETGQGYLYFKPMPELAMTQLIANTYCVNESTDKLNINM
ncbi:EAL domain-containing protein [Catenovulum sp. SM1970]|uniref:bifunctional diguanylate cyclase/phosphodiesterase n=1 Tax=Marinifaba aquimaris TaxID=2741323 RepID=UPI0015741D7A|nr:EAL domain-containing protein [Marinifaba aquimaris]NTS78024.1 EAL domain-containing protein [Marinifaba aquimaris]